MPEMNRVNAGHGSGSSLNPYKSGGGSAGSFFDLLKTHRLIEHDKWSTVAGHVLGERERDAEHGRLTNFHGQVSKNAQPGTELNFQRGDVSARYTLRTPKQKQTKPNTGTFSPVKMAEEPQMEAPASTSHATTAASAPRAENHTVNLGKTIPTHPGTWEGGWMEHNPKTGQAQTKPGYNEFKTRKQHFETGLASQQGHFAVKPEIKIPNYARKAMQPKKPRGK